MSVAKPVSSSTPNSFPFERMGGYLGTSIFARMMSFLGREEARCCSVARFFNQRIKDSPFPCHGVIAGEEEVSAAFLKRITGLHLTLKSGEDDERLERFVPSKTPRLTNLTLFNGAVTDRALNQLVAGRPNLTALQLVLPTPSFDGQHEKGYHPPTPAGFASIAGCAERLQRFELHDTHPSSIRDDHLTAAELTRARLTELQLMSCRQLSTAKLVQLLGSQPALTGLTLVDCSVTPAVAKALSSSQVSLRSLNLYGSIQNQTDPAITAILTAISSLTSLRWLFLQNAQVTKEGFKEFSNLTNLTLLDIEGSRAVTDVCLKALSSLPLKDLIMGGCTQLTDAGLDELTFIRTLQRLKIQSVHVTDSGLSNLISNLSLRHLELDCPQVTSGCIGRLQDTQRTFPLAIRITRDFDLGGLSDEAKASALNHLMTNVVPELGDAAERAHTDRLSEIALAESDSEEEPLLDDRITQVVQAWGDSQRERLLKDAAKAKQTECCAIL